MQYRPEIDGLRAISVSLVVLFHAGFPAFTGGFVGVDIFYVISGYLITKLLVHERDATGTIDLAAFWARRMRRILPAAVTVLCLSFVAACFVLPSLEVTQSASDLMAAALYYANWRFAETAQNYFAQSKGSIFLNYWSLAIEEQFYILWPVLIIGICWAAHKLGRTIAATKTVFHLAAGVFVISFAYCLWLSAYDTSLAFYSTFSRAWELSLGALVATGAPTLTRRARNWLTLVGLFAISGIAIFIPSGAAYPGLSTLIPTCGAAAVIAANAGESLMNVASRFLRLRGAVLIGKLSYSWYLWHWPVFFLGRAYLGTTTCLQDLLLIFISLSLAYVTYVVIETPVRFAGRFASSARTSILSGATLSVSAALFALFAQATFAKSTIVLSDGKRFDASDVLDQMGAIYHDGCHLTLRETAYEACIYGDAEGAHTALLFGDSIAAAWFPALQIAAETQHWKLVSRTKSMCSPSVIEEQAPQLGRAYDECNAWRGQVLKDAARERPDVVFIAESSTPPLKTEGLDARAADATYARGDEALVRQLLATTDAQIILLRMPALGFRPVECLLAHPRAEATCTTTLEEAARLSPFPRGKFEANRRIRIVDLGRDICPSGTCRAYQGGQIIMRDDVHLTPMFARTIAAPFERILADYKS